MTTVALEKEWIETAQLFGDVKNIVKEALRVYAIQQCQQRAENATAKVEVFNRKYNRDYEKFKESIQTDYNFLQKIESEYPMWEQDAIEWEYWLEEQQTWRNRLTTILHH
ncbi:hypothetical protein L0Z72_11365 [candidate division KSB1 bacterium]|nr:hypothetical protein [candidate division KSB1 bacterium]